MLWNENVKFIYVHRKYEKVMICYKTENGRKLPKLLGSVPVEEWRKLKLERGKNQKRIRNIVFCVFDNNHEIAVKTI